MQQCKNSRLDVWGGNRNIKIFLFKELNQTKYLIKGLIKDILPPN